MSVVPSMLRCTMHTSHFLFKIHQCITLYRSFCNGKFFVLSEEHLFLDDLVKVASLSQHVLRQYGFQDFIMLLLAVIRFRPSPPSSARAPSWYTNSSLSSRFLMYWGLRGLCASCVDCLCLVPAGRTLGYVRRVSLYSFFGSKIHRFWCGNNVPLCASSKCGHAGGVGNMLLDFPTTS